MGTLEPVKKALTDSLGVRFEGEKGQHFFQSTLIQTLFYGIFSAWVLWHESHPKSGERFQWRLSAQNLGLPILRTLFVQLAGDPKKIRALNLEEVLDWTEDTLARVDRFSFFQHYDMGEAVQYFYEPFLAEFDPELRKDFGVWYTPPEVVRYMVGSVDRSLRENFGLADGLADPSVVVLDPCCGTGAYVVETLRLVHRRLVEAYGEAQAALKIREVAKSRLYGFELLPAPYVVAHLQIDLLLTRWGAGLEHESDERAGIYLTNALTGWVPVAHPKNLPFSEFSDERDAADQVKQREEILVILGNPPYDGYAGLAVDEERALSEAYRETKAAPRPQGQGLNDLYIRFFRMAERRIAEGVPQSDDPRPGPPRAGGKGIVCFISNYSWLDGLSHTGMRERFMEVFDRIRIDCLNGDKYKTGKKTPDGRPEKTRDQLLASGISSGSFVRYHYRPFDVRWLYWTPTTKLLDEKRPDYVRQVSSGNLWLSATQRNRKEGFYCPQVTREIADHHVVESNVGMFPLYILDETEGAESKESHPDLFTAVQQSGPRPNLTPFALDYLAKLGATPEDLFFHVVAILHAPAYREENAGALRQDWPRVPLPQDASTLRAGAALGRQLAALLDPETPVPGVTDLKVRDDLKGLGELALAPGQKTPDLALAARWGYAGQGGVTMPGPGKVTDGTRGEGYLDIHLNANTRWKDVPEPVWRYTLGGYQVLKKWLSYRESALLGRPLTSDEAQQFTHHVRRIAGILALGGELDGHYRASV